MINLIVSIYKYICNFINPDVITIATRTAALQDMIIQYNELKLEKVCLENKVNHLQLKMDKIYLNIKTI